MIPDLMIPDLMIPDLMISDLTHLPDELKVHLISFCNRQERAELAATCHHFQGLTIQTATEEVKRAFKWIADWFAALPFKKYKGEIKEIHDLKVSLEATFNLNSPVNLKQVDDLILQIETVLKRCLPKVALPYLKKWNSSLKGKKDLFSIAPDIKRWRLVKKENLQKYQKDMKKFERSRQKEHQKPLENGLRYHLFGVLITKHEQSYEAEIIGQMDYIMQAHLYDQALEFANRLGFPGRKTVYLQKCIKSLIADQDDERALLFISSLDNSHQNESLLKLGQAYISRGQIQKVLALIDSRESSYQKDKLYAILAYHWIKEKEYERGFACIAHIKHAEEKNEALSEIIKILCPLIQNASCPSIDACLKAASLIENPLTKDQSSILLSVSLYQKEAYEAAYQAALFIKEELQKSKFLSSLNWIFLFKKEYEKVVEITNNIARWKGEEETEFLFCMAQQFIDERGLSSVKNYALAFKSLNQRSVFLMAICLSCIEQKDYRAVYTLLDSMEEKDLQSLTASKVAVLAIDSDPLFAKEFCSSLSTYLTVDEAFYKERIVLATAMQFAKLGNYSEAFAFVSSPPFADFQLEPQVKMECLDALLKTALNAQRYELALAITGAMSAEDRDPYLKVLCHRFFLEKREEEAFFALSLVSQKGIVSDSTLLKFCRQLIEEERELLAQKFARSIQNQEECCQILLKIGEILLKKKEESAFFALVEEMPLSRYKGKLLAKMVTAKIAAELYKPAWKIAKSIEDPFFRDECFFRLCLAIAKKGAPNKALSMAQAIGDPLKRQWALSSVIKSFIKEKQLAKALKLMTASEENGLVQAPFIQAPLWHAPLQKKIALFLIGKGAYHAAYRLAQQISQRQPKRFSNRALLQLCKKLTAKRQYNWAAKMVKTLLSKKSGPLIDQILANALAQEEEKGKEKEGDFLAQRISQLSLS